MRPIWQTRNLDLSCGQTALVALNLGQGEAMYRDEVPTSPAVLNLEYKHADADTLVSAWMSDDVAGFVYSPQHAAQQVRSASIRRQSHVCCCGRGAASDGDRTREAEVGGGGRGCGRRRAMVSHRGGERRRRKVGVIDK
jgi:hypothetical protein